MIGRVVLAIVIAVFVGVILLLLGDVLDTLKAPLATAVGGWLKDWGWVLGVLAGLWFFFSGGSVSFPKFGKKE